MTKELWPGGPLFKEEEGIQRIGADSVLLADFAGKTSIKKIKRAADLGCGSGIISVLLAYNVHELRIDAVDIQPAAAVLARENAKLSGFSNRITAIEGDLRRLRGLLQNGAYDLVVSNPPYNKHGSGKLHSNKNLASARDDELCTLDDLCEAAGYLTRRGGSFALVHKPERLADIFRALSSHGFEPKRMRYVQHKQASPPNLVLIDSIKGGKPPLTIEPPMILTNEDGSDSDEVKRIYRINDK